ncbi:MULTISPECIES: hypothetical protein [unclassified Gilliamella]|uniref:hypothetical protein n=1 Tax=unclassified Gilliamella TaxID=2685620 RepID=UPI00226AA1FD|nr:MULTISPECIES: hypothetical protein [unclassified Gilliamella]MCX8642497.1 hypothetical protein [Gilliamella sp. B3835]MCX8706347.1 hypothetical protein [Gilliamella sp. B3783]MCX8709753.1 hypothetical protein [Gilliamella sp. B3780]MCX8712144.1 hypothetical protein [Gilliamella sp. B3468]MCX8714398.1 hypothetical protein [Gilliamella sp. B3781]
MKKLAKSAAILIGLLMFSSAYCDELPPVSKVSSAIVNSAKKSILGENGKFPYKTADGTELTNISANSNNIIFEYKIPADSQTLPVQDLSDYFRVQLKDEFCNKQDVVNVLSFYDIRFLFRFQYSDDRNVPATLSIKEICQ